jgi:hypothetical protein
MEDNSPTSYVWWLYYDYLGWDPLYPSFYMPRGGRVYMEDLVGYGSTKLGLYLYFIYKI